MNNIDKRVQKLELKAREFTTEDDDYARIGKRLGISPEKFAKLKEFVRSLPSIELMRYAEMELPPQQPFEFKGNEPLRENKDKSNEGSVERLV